MAVKNKNRDKCNLARELYLQGISQTEICERVGISQPTLKDWKTAENWDRLREIKSTTKTELLENAYNQLHAIDTMIEARGFVPDKFLIDGKSLALKQIAMFSETQIVQYVECFEEFIKYMNRNYPNRVKEFSNMYMEFVQHLQSEAGGA